MNFGCSVLQNFSAKFCAKAQNFGEKFSLVLYSFSMKVKLFLEFLVVLNVAESCILEVKNVFYEHKLILDDF